MEQTLKQRLVGAIVLISLGVIFIPIILEGPDDEWTPRVQEMPAPPRIHYQTQPELPVSNERPEPAVPARSPQVETVTPPGRAVVPDEPAVEEVAADKSVAKQDAVDTAVETKTDKKVTPAPAPVLKTPPVPEPKPKPGPKPAPAVSTGGWVVQVGSFSQAQNATGLRDRLRKSGYTVFLRDARRGERRIYRVLLGPVAKRAEAERLRDNVARRHRLKGLVIENPG
jgi:DedD protein